MSAPGTRHLPALPDAIAPDGCDVRVLLALGGGSMAHFELAPGRVSTAISHRSVEEIWYFVSGRGQMWRRQGGRETIEAVHPGVCVTIPRGTAFQVRSIGGAEPLAAIGVTMPPWPGDDEAVIVAGPWTPAP